MATWKSSSKKKQKSAPQTYALADLQALPTEAEMLAVNTARARALSAFDAESSAQAAIDAATHVYAVDEVVRLKIVQPQGAVACQKGCTWCCYQKVGATVPEVLAIAEYLRASTHQLDWVRERAATLATDARIFSDAAKREARIPCALLSEDGGCQAYEVRPLPCRGWLSRSEQSCQDHLDSKREPEFLFDVARMNRAVQLGLAKAMDDLQLQPYVVELTSGLDVALNEPNAAERWLAGEPVFERASVTRPD